MKFQTLFLKFALVGAMGTVIHYMVMVSLVELMGMDPGISAMAGASCGAISNYFFNYHFTFKSDKSDKSDKSHISHIKALPRFVFVAGIAVVLNGLIVKALTLLEMNYFLSQIFATLFILGINFFLSKTWIFKKTQQ